MDASELFPIVGAVLAAALAAAVCWRLRLLPSRGLRVAAMGVTGGLAVLALVVMAVLVWFDRSYTRELKPLVSPDGRHVAITSYTINNGTGVDQAEVAIRRAWSPYAHRVYVGPSKYQPGESRPEPAVRWIDNGRLEIQFHSYGLSSEAASEQGCAAQADGIEISCVETRVHVVR